MPTPPYGMREQAAIRFYEVFFELQFERPSIKLRLLFLLICIRLQNYEKSCIFRHLFQIILWTHSFFFIINLEFTDDPFLHYQHLYPYTSTE